LPLRSAASGKEPADPREGLPDEQEGRREDAADQQNQSVKELSHARRATAYRHHTATRDGPSDLPYPLLYFLK